MKLIVHVLVLLEQPFLCFLFLSARRASPRSLALRSGLSAACLSVSHRAFSESLLRVLHVPTRVDAKAQSVHMCKLHHLYARRERKECPQTAKKCTSRTRSHRIVRILVVSSSTV